MAPEPSPVVMAPSRPQDSAAPLGPADEANSRVPAVVSTGAARRAAGCSMRATKRCPATALPKSTAQRLPVDTT